MDTEQNCRKFAVLCSKEVKKRYQKSVKIQKDFNLRAKRMYRDMANYWRKQEKDLQEIKKKLEKLEAEKRRREEEEKESIL